MPSDGEGKIVRTVHTYGTVIIAVVVVFIGVALLYASGSPSFEHNQPSLQTLIRELGALLVVTGGITVLWDLKGRRDFADEVLTGLRPSPSRHACCWGGRKGLRPVRDGDTVSRI